MIHQPGQEQRPYRKRKRKLALAITLALAVGLAGKAWSDTMAVPEVVSVAFSTQLGSANLPVRIALLSDIHVAGPDMPPSRLRGIVKQVNALKPDLVLIAGDMVSEKRTATQLYSAQEAIEPLAELVAPLGVIAVPGNHDHWLDIGEVTEAFGKAGVSVLANDAVQAGPLAIAGVDDDFTGRADLERTLGAARGLSGPLIILTHSPDIFPQVPDGSGLVLAGHTHCGQIAWPWGGSPATMSRYGQRYACGVTRERGNMLVTSGGLGTSVLPFRLFTRPQIWLVTVGGS
ncbi:metallophosphoesterase [Paraurantiacibacter namhicola]|uniref:Putative metallophosphoesterase n=1 Tax=Paraurantiacibacter namhicola TaxID=645517 RepID=A0A1C7DA61_9SPHN|nr:metallophosphoesterase [Paraurantiacibacter namhicola]ANU08262.1 putative metallophosphoesterase [Paraurantiacibacter namhicola]